MNSIDIQSYIPKEVRSVALTLEASGYESYVVGGCIRDILMDREPSDYDIATSATPEQILLLFPKTFYENSFGTVGVVTCGEGTGIECSDNKVRVVEVTPFRTESTYSDKRHPDKVSFTTNVYDDLARRDFTVNALAYRVTTGELLDVYGGQEDISKKILKTVGEPVERFNEDALRMLRAIRFSAQLGFHVEQMTKDAILKLSENLKYVSRERVRDEFSKIILSDEPMNALILSRETGLLQYFFPDLERGVGIRQNQAHSFDVWEHNLRTLQHAADMKWPFHVRLSAILHDISKPETRRFAPEKNDYTFYGHDVVGGRVAKKVLSDLKYPKDVIDRVSLFVRWHMFFSDTEQITLSAVRRLIANVGRDNVWDLMDLRVCDRIGTGRPKAEPFRLRKYKAMVEQAMHDPVSVGMLKIDGLRIMVVTCETPGPKIGYVLHALLEEVLEDPSKNTIEYLESRAVLHMKLSIDELKKLGAAGKEKIEEKEQAEIKKIQRKHKV